MNLRDVVFFASGLAAVVDEAVWARLLARIVGSDAGGTALTLGMFMGGMGLGAWVFGPVAARLKDPRRAWWILEGFVALWAWFSADLLTAVDPVSSPWLRAGIACLTLLPPTLAMGAGFPLMGRLSIESRAQSGEATSRFYGANTLGACSGALLAAFVLMPTFGLEGALRVSAGVDFLAGALGMRLLLGPVRTGPTRVDPGEAGAIDARQEDSRRRRCLGACALLGGSSLALEVVLTRLLIQLTGASIYAFALVLAVFLLGLGIGARQAAGVLRRHTDPISALTSIVQWIPALALGGLAVLRLRLGEQDLFGNPHNLMPSGLSPLRLWLAQAFLAAIVLVPPAIAFGMALPMAAGVLCTAETRSPERSLGQLYAANTVGATLGALAGGLLLLPFLGVRASIPIALVPALLAGWILTGVPRSTRAFALVVALLGGLLALRPHGDSGLERRLRHEIGRHASATVVERDLEGGGTIRSLRVNGKVVATTAPVDLRLQRLLSLIPALLHGDVERAGVIGLGTGMTAGALLGLPTLERLELLEISGAVVRASDAFRPWNNAVLHDPRTELHLVDGRHALATREGRFDLLTSDPIHPWTRGSSDLYSLEHFRSMAEHLEENGVASQWLPLYQLSDEDVRTVVATWLGAFPEASAWITAYDLALVGSHRPLRGLDLTSPWSETLAKDLAGAGIHDPSQLAALQCADRPRLEAFCRGVEPMVDNRPVLEFRAPRSFLAGYSLGALTWAADPIFLGQLPGVARERGGAIRELLTQFVQSAPGDPAGAAEVYGRALMEPPGPGD